MYTFIRNILFLLPPELAHSLSLKILTCLPKSIFTKPKKISFNCMGIEFPHKIGLAAGFDKNAKYLNALAKIGFAFIEVGTVTPKPQSGNPKPRLFRLEKSKALINRMGFNNQGVDNLVMNVQKSKYNGILGINIGKNKDTPLDHAVYDYIYCMQRVYKYADYITINISSPNTANLRKLQEIDYLDEFINKICVEHKKLVAHYNDYVPLVLKISPDESLDVLTNISKVALKYKIDGIIATNTSSARFNLDENYINEVGGLSGKPILDIANSTLLHIKNIVGDNLILIGSGGVNDAESANKKYDCGASLLQVYTGFIYNGPNLLRNCLDLEVLQKP